MSNKWKYYSTMFFWCHTDILHGWFTFLAFFFCIKNRTMHRKYFVLLLEKKRIVCIRFFLIEILCFLNWSIFWKNLKRLKKLSLGHILVAAKKLQWVRDVRACNPVLRMWGLTLRNAISVARSTVGSRDRTSYLRVGNWRI